MRLQGIQTKMLSSYISHQLHESVCMWALLLLLLLSFKSILCSRLTILWLLLSWLLLLSFGNNKKYFDLIIAR